MDHRGFWSLLHSRLDNYSGASNPVEFHVERECSSSFTFDCFVTDSNWHAEGLTAMFKDEILENENRRKIYSLIEDSPGIHMRELQRALDMPLTTLEYHLTYMARKRVVFKEADSHYNRYYVRPLDSGDKKILSALRQKRMRDIVFVVLVNKKVKFQFLADQLELPNSTLSFYLKYLVDNMVLAKEKVGYENIYTIRDEDRVARVLIAYKSSFLDKMVDKALATWMETYSSKKKPT